MISELLVSHASWINSIDRDLNEVRRMIKDIKHAGCLRVLNWIQITPKLEIQTSLLSVARL